MSHVQLNLPGQPPGDSSALGLAKAALATGRLGLWEALDSALKSRRLDVCGSTIDASDRHGVTALHLAANAGRVSTVRALIRRGASVDPCTVEVEGDDEEEEEDEEFNAGDWQADSGWTPLLLACRGGHHECVSVLVAAGASVHASVDRNSGGDCVESTLTLSAETGDSRSLQMMLDAGAPVHVPANSWSPLHAATWGGGEVNEECIMALLRAGADINAVDHVERSVLELAIQPRNPRGPRLVSTLLRKGARPLAADCGVLDYYSIKVENPQIVAYFDAIRRAGGYARYEAMRRAPFVTALTRCFPLPSDTIPLVVEFWVRRALEY